MARLYFALAPDKLYAFRDRSYFPSMASWKKKTSGNYNLICRAFIFLSLTTLVHINSAYKQESCIFPPRWNGRWFQSGVQQQIVIEGDRLSSKGKCLSAEGDKFLIYDEKRCYRCVVIHEKHINVLQYKESFCLPREALPTLCSMINGDALLYSMFRENATPVNCPLRGPFSFTYNRGHGECKSPVSSIESCTEESRLLLNYQACPDVHGSESTVEELECLATWKEGSLRYLVGKIHHNHATSNEDRYRCFVYEKSNGIGSHSLVKEGDEIEYKVAQSGDATCNGLFSATEGSRTMALKRVPMSWKCRFPSWMAVHGHWHTLDYSSTYSFHQKNATLRITNQTGADIKVHCAQVKTPAHVENSAILIAHWQHHCVGQYVCLGFYRRSLHVAEMQIGQPTGRIEDACSTTYFDTSSTPYITLVTSNPESKDCPYAGKFTVTGVKLHQRNTRSLETKHSNNTETLRTHKHNHRKKSTDDKLTSVERRKKKYQKFLEKIFAKEAMKREKYLRIDTNGTRIFNANSTAVDDVSNVSLNRSRRSTANIDNTCVNNEFTMLDIGCNSVVNMEFHSTCDNKELITAYSCHGGWYENGTSFLITTPLTRNSIGAKRFCFVYKETQDKMIHFTRSSFSCDRSIRPGIDGAVIFNATNSGGCVETSLAVTNNQSMLKTLLINCLISFVLILHPTMTR